MKLPITKERIQTHFHYAWWQYVLLISLAIFGWNLLYTTTRYRSPEHLKVEWYCEGAMALDVEDKANALMEELHQSLLADMEEVTFVPIAYDQTYGDMQLFVWANAGQGDLYLVTQERFKNLAQNGAMLDLAPYVEDGTLPVEGVDLAKGYATDPDTGKRYLMGIPADTLTGLEAYGMTGEGKLFGVLVNGGNIDNTLKLLRWLLENMR